MKWKKIERNENYSISENGDVRNDRKGTIKKPFVNKVNGYLTVDLWKDNKSTKVPIHRLLAETFIPNPNNLPCVDHKDGNRQNNSLSNLRWASYSDNNSRFGTRGVRSERIRVTHYKELRNKSGWGHVEWLDIDAVMIFERITDAANHFGVTLGNISMMLKHGEIGRRGKMRGYIFEYISECESETTIESTRKTRK